MLGISYGRRKRFNYLRVYSKKNYAYAFLFDSLTKCDCRKSFIVNEMEDTIDFLDYKGEGGSGRSPRPFWLWL